MGNPYAPPGRNPATRQPSSPPNPVPPPRPRLPPVAPQPDPKDLQSARRRVLLFAAGFAAVMVTSALPFPVRLLGIAVVAATLTVGVKAIRANVRLRTRGALLPALCIAMGLVGILGLQLVLSLAAWDIEVARQRCLDGALTGTARESCVAVYEQSIKDLVPGSAPAWRPPSD